MRTLLRAAILAVVTLPCWAAAPPVTDAEKAACEAVADHLARGAGAFAERLAADSALATLDGDATLREIAARVGPTSGTTWELRTSAPDFRDHGAVFHVVYASGLDDVIALTMKREASGWKVAAIRTLAETASAHNAPVAETSFGNAPQSLRTRVFSLLLGAQFLAIAGAILRHRRRVLSSLLLIGALAAFCAALAWLLDPRWTDRALRRRAPALPNGMMAMGELTALRDAGARGKALPLIESSDAVTRELAELWSTAATLGNPTPEASRKRLARLQLVAGTPLAALLEARLDAEEGEFAEAAKRYRFVRETPPAHDTFWLEESIAEARSTKKRELEVRDTRDASFYYTRVIERLLAGDPVGTRTAFQDAWRLQPVSRPSLIASGILGLLVTDPTIAPLVNLDAPEEQRTRAFDLSRSPMRVPPRARTTACGMLVRIDAGGGTLLIPGGSAIAPRETQILSGSEAEREQRDRDVRSAESMNAPPLTSSSVQRTVEAAAEALAAHHDWKRIAELTQSLTPDSTNVPLSLVTWRVRALVRLGRIDDARRLVAGSAVSGASLHRQDVNTFLELAELMADGGAFDAAVDLVKRASQIAGAGDVSASLQKMELRQRLAASPPLTATAHFEIHATPDVPATVAERVGQLLEAELQRLSTILGARDFRRVRVNVTSWDQFSNQLTGTEHIVGFYDGDITVPFGEVARFREEVVSILTHELTHAIIAQQTSDNAPRWFQEGMARRMELVERQENAFASHRDQRFHALEILDETMSNSMDPDAVADAYLIAQTLIRYLEDRYGAAAPSRLIAAFAKGADTNEALHDSFGVAGMNDLDRDFREWGRSHAEPFVDATPWPYGQFYSLGIDPNVRNAIHFSRPRRPQP